MDSLAVLLISGFAIGSILYQWLMETRAPPAPQQDEPEEINPYDHLFDEERV
jgi:hypothetical protein